MGECLDWHLLKAAHKALYDEHWPTNLRLEDVQHGRRLHSNITINPKIPLKSDTLIFKTVSLSIRTNHKITQILSTKVCTK